MTRYSVQAKVREYVTGCGFLSFAGKYGQKYW